LVALADVSSNISGMVKPEIIPASNPPKPMIHIKGLRHPCVEETVKNFVPNDVYIGGDEPLIHLITGPNMGGKSTLLRQT